MTGILTGFFFSALICHLALSQSRPDASRLTEFYLYVSLGGVLGGAFAALLAPVIFNNVYEYPLALAAACLFRPRGVVEMPRLADASVAASIAMAICGTLLFFRYDVPTSLLVLGALGASCCMLAAGWSSGNRPPIFRYAFFGIGLVHAALVFWIAFHVGDVFVVETIEDVEVLRVAAPWGAVLIATSLASLMFAVHWTVQPRGQGESSVSDFAVGGAIPSLLLLILLPLMGARLDAGTIVPIGLLLSAIAIFLNRQRPIFMAIVVLSAFVALFMDDARGGRIITQERTFFGVLRTREFASGDPMVPGLRVLLHGTTLHGAQMTPPGPTRQPMTYYHPRTALGDAITAGLSTHEHSRLALIGLGTGSTACLTRPDDELTIYEIDPAIVDMSIRPGGDFTFVPECQPDARVVLGDARLRIADAPDESFEVIVVDAFSSDAIPAHLLTREALELYLSKISERGIIVLHLSNRNLALVSEAARVARDLEVPTLFRISDAFELTPPIPYGSSAASVMIVARSPATFASLPLSGAGWRIFEAPDGPGWTDDYINLPRALWEGLPWSGIENCRIYPWLRECGGDPLAQEMPAAPADPTQQ
jgi:hypothetical protein